MTLKIASSDLPFPSLFLDLSGAVQSPNGIGAPKTP